MHGGNNGKVVYTFGEHSYEASLASKNDEYEIDQFNIDPKYKTVRSTCTLLARGGGQMKSRLPPP